jgi:hypothetical protein
MRSRTSSTTPHRVDAEQRFQIIHPYHPLFQQEFDLVQYRRNWGEDRVYFHATSGDLTSVPAIWTNLSSTDPFVAVAAGRSLFRVDDLVELAALVAALEQRDAGTDVKSMMPIV